MRASAVAVLAFLALATTSLADHVYTHRYVASGRLVDESGRGVPDVRVELVVDGVSSLDAPCRRYADEMRIVDLGLSEVNRTNAHGDFETCVHTHALSPRASAVVKFANATRPLSLDLGARITFVGDVCCAGGSNATPPALVRVRVVQPARSPLVLDGVPASGEALAGVRVDVLRNGTPMANLTTDRYGDAAVYDAAAQATYRILVAGAPPLEAATDATHRRVEGVVRLPASDFARGVGSPGESAPIPAVGIGALVAVAAGLSLVGRNGR